MFLTRFIRQIVIHRNQYALRQRMLCTSSANSEEDISLDSLKLGNEAIGKLSSEMRERYDKTLAEFEIFVYMSTYVPREMSDDAWLRSIQFKDLKEKVDYWQFLAIKQRRREGRDKRKQRGSEDYQRFLAEQNAKYTSGGMGYGPDMYQLVHNPMRNKKKIHNIEGSRVFKSMMTNMPTVALDVQYIERMPFRQQAELGNQMQYVISENFSASRPFLLDFVNSPINETMDKWKMNCVGYYSGEYNNQTLLPEFTAKGIKETYGRDKNIIYLSNYARDVIDGPLRADVIGVCVSMDFKRDSIGAARRAGIRAYRLPIHRYVKWKSGPQFLPFPNLLNVLRQVYENGGDWRTALLNNISKRHLVDPNEDEQKRQQALRRKAKEEEKRELIEAIRSAT